MIPTDITRKRSLPVSLLAVIATVAAMFALVAGEHTASADSHSTQTADHAQTTAAGHHATSTKPLNARQASFQDLMRKLWEDHITWTRLAIVTFVDGSPGFDATAARLLSNQTAIGNVIKPFYGDAAGDQLTGLLEEHITIAVELLQAAKAGNDAAVSDTATRWYANSDDIADFLAAANPEYWPQQDMRAAMKGHLDQTLAEAQHELAGDYAASVADYDVIHAHILGMADVLSNGIMRSFPGRFR